MEPASTSPTRARGNAFAAALAALPYSAACALRRLVTRLQSKGKGMRRQHAERLALKRSSTRNPAGSKLVRRWMRNATGQRMTFEEANRQFNNLVN